MRRKKKNTVVEEASPEETGADESIDSIEGQEPVEQAPETAEPTEPQEDWKDKYLRVLAELDNVRKRAERDRAQVHKFALEDVLRNILPVLDSLQYALASEGDAEAIREGVELAIKDAHRILGEKGLTPIEALHEPFDPRWHEAVGRRPSDEHPAGTVIAEERRGYMLHDRVLRPSRVHVSFAPPSPADESKEADQDGDSDADV